MKNDNPRRLMDTNITSMDLVRFKSQGLTPYYFENKMGDGFGLVIFDKPLKGLDYNNKPRLVFLLR